MDAKASIVTRRGMQYPNGDDFFSPSERFPEYPFDTISKSENPVYRLVRQALADAGLDRRRFGSPSWNPLGGYMAPGSRVFVLCNFVHHRRPVESLRDFQAKCIHGSVLRALIDYAWIAVGAKGNVVFGNAPLQSCKWSRVLADTGADRAAGFYAAEGASVRAEDLRLFAAEKTILGRTVRSRNLGDDSFAAVFDLGGSSLLAERRDESSPFRVMDYNPDRTDRYHSRASHVYVIHKSVLDAQTIVSLPKLKTHEKVGLTCALKGMVGSVAHKDCLAHHRFGSPSRGGDEFPARHAFATPLSHFHDWLNRRGPGSPLQGSMEVLHYLVSGALRRLGVTLGGSWHGNDTAWRMVLDLHRILQYGDSSGALHRSRQRRHLVLVDGIVGGEGNGPLAPRPVDCGTLLFADEPALADRIAWRLMGYRPEALPLLRVSRTMGRQEDAADGEPSISSNGRPVAEEEVTPVLSRPFTVPRGWRSYLSRHALESLNDCPRSS